MEALLNSRAHAHAHPHMTTHIRIRMDTGSSSERTEHSRGGHPCSLRPQRCETSGDAPPFLKALGTHRISRSGPHPPTFTHSLPPRRRPCDCRPRARHTPSRIHAAARSNTTRARSTLCGRSRSRVVPAPIACGSWGIICKRPAVGHAVATTPCADPRPLVTTALAAHPRP
jgi:hypothetical protein